MGKSLDELASYFRPAAAALIDKANAAELDVVIEDTGRTLGEQAQKILTGVSWTNNSKHLPQPPEGLSEAIDLAPRAVMSLKNWAPNSPLWDQLGALGEGLGLRWGGRWPGTRRDPGHFEFIHVTTTVEVT